jgi:hypothetical protein
MIQFSRAVGQKGCMSNFYKAPVTFDGLTYKNSEAAWQAQKTLDLDERKKFCDLDGAGAKRLGRHIKLRSDWEDVKFQLMIDVCYAKFSQNTALKNYLLSTGDEELAENTTGWHDNIWGNCDCPKCASIQGKNLLGKALMQVRSMLREES